LPERGDITDTNRAIKYGVLFVADEIVATVAFVADGARSPPPFADLLFAAVLRRFEVFAPARDFEQMAS
jgi:hypothetical protein